jgi:hypothetical protein
MQFGYGTFEDLRDEFNNTDGGVSSMGYTFFDYSYRYFYTDGYGKDFSVFNLDAKSEYSQEQNRRNPFESV